MRSRDFLLPFIVLALTMSVGCGQHGYVFHVEVGGLESGRPLFTWAGDPARELDVYRCAAACPDESSLSTYLEETQPFQDDAAVTPVWTIVAMSGVESGHGTIPSPVEYGVLREDLSYETGAPAEPLEPGAYLVRVIQGEGNYFQATFGTAWASFLVP